MDEMRPGIVAARDDVEYGAAVAKGLAGVLLALATAEIDLPQESIRFLAEGASAAADRVELGSSKLGELVADIPGGLPG